MKQNWGKHAAFTLWAGLLDLQKTTKKCVFTLLTWKMSDMQKQQDHF